MADKPLYTCPNCGRQMLVDHCETSACTWMMCRGKEDCGLVFDTRNNRGHVLTEPGPHGVRPRVNWVKP